MDRDRKECKIIFYNKECGGGRKVIKKLNTQIGLLMNLVVEKVPIVFGRIITQLALVGTMLHVPILMIMDMENRMLCVRLPNNTNNTDSL